MYVNACGIDRINEVRRGSLRPKGRADYHILYVASGECHVQKHGAWNIAPAGSVIFFRPLEYQEYYYCAGSNSTSYFLHFTGTNCQNLLLQLGISHLDIHAMGIHADFEAVFHRMLSAFSLKQRFYEHSCAADLQQLLVILSRSVSSGSYQVPDSHRKQIEQVQLWICHHLDCHISLEDMAAQCCMSPGRFSHVFRQCVGIPPHAYLSTLRLEKAKELLLYTPDSLNEIAHQIGMPDPNYFSRFFKRATGLSPSAFRRSFFPDP